MSKTMSGWVRPSTSSNCVPVMASLRLNWARRFWAAASTTSTKPTTSTFGNANAVLIHVSLMPPQPTTTIFKVSIF